MFTGIVQSIGRLSDIEARGDGIRIAIDIGIRDIVDVEVGDSVAVNGCCLTVVAINGSTLDFDVSAETLRCTTALDKLGDVNLEMALRATDRLGGHLVAGHVDGIGTVVQFAAREDGGVFAEIACPADLARFIAAKGSIAVHGVSLTVNGVNGSRFDVNLIPHTLAVTTLGTVAPGRQRQSGDRSRCALRGALARSASRVAWKAARDTWLLIQLSPGRRASWAASCTGTRR
jgi:riboflavin synthase